MHGMLAIGRYSTAGTDARETDASSHLYPPEICQPRQPKASRQLVVASGKGRAGGLECVYSAHLREGLSCFHALRAATWRKISPTLPHAEKGNGTTFDVFWPGG